MSSNSKIGSLVKVGVLFILVAAVTAASVGLLVQHRKLDELNRDRGKQNKGLEKIVAEHHAVKAANETLTENLKKLHDDLGKCENERDSIRGKVTQQFANQVSSLKNDLAAAKTKCEAEAKARKRAEAEVKKLNKTVKALKQEMKKLRAERDELEQELNSAMQPAAGGEQPAVPATPATPAPPQEVQPPPQDPDDLILIRQPPPEDNLTPEEREARNKAEFDELIGL